MRTGDGMRHIAMLLRAVPIPALAVDGRGRVLSVNQAAEAMFGPDLTDRPFVTVIRTATVNQALDWVLSDRHDTPPMTPDATLPPPADGGLALRAVLNAKGEDRACEVTVSPISGGAVVVLQDTSGVEHAEEMRRDFVANVSHELRTPLTALMGFIETLRGPARDDAGARDRFLSIMEREASRMNRLVADLLSLSRVESDERRRPSQRVDLAGILRGTVATLSPAARDAGVALFLDVPDDAVLLPGDSDQLTQVFSNLIENAVKYGGSGEEVRIRAFHVAHEPLLRGPAWSVEVSDHGEGIEERHLPRLTERFYRVDAHRSREKGGTGLGLAIVKHIINRHRGRLRIASQRGQGSSFTVTLPERQDRR